MAAPLIRYLSKQVKLPASLLRQSLVSWILSILFGAPFFSGSSPFTCKRWFGAKPQITMDSLAAEASLMVIASPTAVQWWAWPDILWDGHRKRGMIFLAGNFLETNPVAYGDGIAIFSEHSACQATSRKKNNVFVLPSLSVCWLQSF